MADLIFPSSAQLELVAQDLLPRLMAQRPVFDFFPVRNYETDLVMWEQMDNFTGLQQVRGINGAPPKVNKTGAKRYASQPGVYGEHEQIDEQELVRRRVPGTLGTPIQISDLVSIAQTKLLQRRLDRIESIVWTLLSTGTFAVAGPSGAIIHTDSYTTQVFTSAVPWATIATATPLADMRAVQLLEWGHSVDFGSNARAYLNRVTLNRFFSNTNSADLGGRRGQGLSTINGPDQLNQLLAMDDLPTLVPYSKGYLNDVGTFVPFIANGVIVVVGTRDDGAPVGEYQMVRNVNNPGMAPGAYTRVIDRGEQFIPRSIEVHDGMSGGPSIRYPSAIVAMTVS